MKTKCRNTRVKEEIKKGMKTDEGVMSYPKLKVW